MQRPNPFSALQFALIFALFGLLLGSCTGIEKVKTGDRAFALKKYMLASSLYKEELKKAKAEVKAEIAFKIADSYHAFNNTDLAEKWYAEAKELGYEEIAILRLAEMQKANEKYQEAIANFKTYVDFADEPSEIKKQIKACELALQWQEDIAFYNLKELEQLNSASNDFGLRLYGTDKVLFTSSRPGSTGEEEDQWTGQLFFDIYQADKNSPQEFSKVERFRESINANFHDGSPTFSPDFKTMYFTRCGGDQESGELLCQIYTSKMQEGEWSEPELVPLFEDSVNVGQPFLSEDGKTLYFAADDPNGFGGSDICFSYPTADGWTGAVNAGSQINTYKDEAFPYFFQDTLYFSSNGHQGMGSFDIFSSAKEGRNWSKAENLKAPINSGADDFGLLLLPVEENETLLRKGYFSSTRKGGTGNDDIYYFELRKAPPPPPPPIIFALKGEVLTKVFQDPDNPKSLVLDSLPLNKAEVKIEQKLGGENIFDKRTKPDGRIKQLLDSNSRYKIIVSKEGYFSKTLEASTLDLNAKPGDEIEIEFQVVLEKIFADQEVKIDNIYYDLDSDKIRADAEPELLKIFKILEENPSLKVELASHTDSRGSAEYNQDLSQRRAQSVVNFMIARGINPRRMSARGYGETQLVNHCANGVPCDDAEHEQNRRTTFKVLSERFVLNSDSGSSLSTTINNYNEVFEKLEEEEKLSLKDQVLKKALEGDGIREEEPELIPRP